MLKNNQQLLLLSVYRNRCLKLSLKFFLFISQNFTFYKILIPNFDSLHYWFIFLKINYKHEITTYKWIAELFQPIQSILSFKLLLIFFVIN